MPRCLTTVFSNPGVISSNSPIFFKTTFQSFPLVLLNDFIVAFGGKKNKQGEMNQHHYLRTRSHKLNFD